jgi:hypothetical protein
MNRHVLVGRLGSGDKIAIPVANGEVATDLQFIQTTKRLDHGIGRALDDLAKLKIYPSETGVDLMVVAAHVHAADTRLSRDTESQDNWTREIRLVIPVKDVMLWQNVKPVVERMLNFLTGDIWTIDFRSRPKGFEKIVNPTPPELLGLPFDGVSLFSGGVDSLIGAIDELEAGRAPLFVSHAGEGAVSTSQETLFRALENHYQGRNVERLRVWMAFPNDLFKDVPAEMTTRGRSFLFFAAGVFASTGLDKAVTLQVPENGLIALNVPLDQLRLGALSTRTTHPFYIARWNELLQILSISTRIQNPYWDRTKGEMVAACANRNLLRRIIADSMSCSSPTKGRWTGHGSEHCGFCLPCLIRRAAIKAGLGKDDPTTYTLADLTAQNLDTRRAEGRQVRSFQLAIDRLKKEPRLASILIHKPGPLSSESAARQASLADVYRRGMIEVGKLLKGVQTTPD